MEEIKNSALLQRIFDRAEGLRTENKCSALTRDYIIVAAILVMGEIPADDQKSDEFAKTRELLANMPTEKDRLSETLEKWREKTIPMTEGIILSSNKGKSLKIARQSEQKQLTADVYLSVLLKGYGPAVAGPQKTEKKPSAGTAEESAEAAPKGQETRTAPGPSGAPEGIGDILARTKKLQTALQDRVLGQQHAINAFASGYFQSELQAAIETDRKRPRATFLFVGPPGVGKTFLSEVAAETLELPWRRFDMSEYTGPNATDELSGSDANYKASSEGQLTGFVNKHPKCVLLFDEIEKANLETIHLFLQILDAGRLRDNRTDKEVSFTDAILIFTTNAGKAIYEKGERNLASITRDVILDALSKEVNPKNGEPFFPAAICSRFASGNVVMFNHLEADTLRMIIERTLDTHVRDIDGRMGIKVRIDEDTATALLLAEGAMADARTVKSRADAFFGGELYELYRLVAAGDQDADVDQVRTINVYVDRENEPEDIAGLFAPLERIHAIAYSKMSFPLDETDGMTPVIHYVSDLEQAREVIDSENIQLLFCDLFCDEYTKGKDYLNREDRDSKARAFLQTMLAEHPGLPVVLTEPEGHSFSEEERISYLRKGAAGFLSLASDQLTQRISQYSKRVFQQNCMTELARRNRLLRYETAQSLHPDGKTADIVLFDMKLEKAIKAEDKDNILSLLSTPDVKFDDVIGAEDAKNELKFFVSYMQQPKKYRQSGAASPKGILLYGPPGTGKTMLAKAFAAESRATFIATEGNRFFTGWVGEGPAMVHKLFASARRYAPSVIFIDEIDAIARARTGRDSDMAQDTEQILHALFTEMDGFTGYKDKPVFVLGATNYQVEQGTAMSLDPAALRRFDRRILVDLPNLENRKIYLKNEIEKKKIFRLSEEGIESMANRSAGMSLAQLASVLDMAVRTAMQKQAEFIDDKLLEEAFETFNSGEAKQWSPEATLRTARHEAGHTLVSWLCGEKPSFVTIVSRGNFGGYMQSEDQEKRMNYTKRELINRIRIALAGRAAEMVYYGTEEGLSTGASGDLKSATELARRILCGFGMDEEFGLAVVDRANEPITEAIQNKINELLKEQLQNAICEIRDNREKIERLVNRLLEVNSLRSNDIDNVLKGDIIE